MRINHSSRLRAAHKHLYQKVAYREPGLSFWQQTKRLLLLLAGAFLVAVLTPFIPSRRHNDNIPSTMDEYAQKLPYSVLFAVFCLAYGVYELLMKPARNRQTGYQLVGRFPVRAKMQVLTSRWLEFAPDDTHRVNVDQQFYDRIEKGDIVEIVYSSYDSLVGIRRIS